MQNVKNTQHNKPLSTSNYNSNNNNNTIDTEADKTNKAIKIDETKAIVHKSDKIEKGKVLLLASAQNKQQ